MNTAVIKSKYIYLHILCTYLGLYYSCVLFIPCSSFDLTTSKEFQFAHEFVSSKWKVGKGKLELEWEWKAIIRPAPEIEIKLYPSDIQ